jgi:hypothetical protein
MDKYVYIYCANCEDDKLISRENYLRRVKNGTRLDLCTTCCIQERNAINGRKAWSIEKRETTKAKVALSALKKWHSLSAKEKYLKIYTINAARFFKMGRQYKQTKYVGDDYV